MATNLKFVEGFSKITSPPTELTRKDVKFIWFEACKKSFQELKKMLVMTHVLTIPNGEDKFIIYNNESRTGIECVLMQGGKVATYALQNLKPYVTLLRNGTDNWPMNGQGTMIVLT